MVSPVLSFDMYFCVSSLWLPIFVSMYKVNLLHFPVLAGWLDVVDALWVSAAQSPKSPAPGAPGVSPVWDVCALLLCKNLDCYWHISRWDIGSG